MPVVRAQGGTEGCASGQAKVLYIVSALQGTPCSATIIKYTSQHTVLYVIGIQSTKFTVQLLPSTCHLAPAGALTMYKTFARHHIHSVQLN